MSEDLECFVCLSSEPPLLTGLCLCTSRALHPQCQRALLRNTPKACSAAASTCGACKAEYANVRQRSTRRPSAVALVAALALLIAACSFFGGALEVMSFVYATRPRDVVWMLALGVVLLAIGCAAGSFGVFVVVAQVRRGARVRDVLCPLQVRVTVVPWAPTLV